MFTAMSMVPSNFYFEAVNAKTWQSLAKIWSKSLQKYLEKGVKATFWIWTKNQQTLVWFFEMG